ncbi:Diaminopimelate epimerase [hydrothermal vent metagenome]|uniref:diaminopimelate epimerase n=1 Tax=hydrothermal vent metagenome TaxID=652676 RepID=A0A3B0QWT7_9ZZZZ
MKLKFTKMHGTGNDFIVLDLRRKKINKLESVVKRLSHRRFAIGFDQALVLRTSRKADFRMDIYNADGGKVEMCGNGIRCLAEYIWKRKLSDKDTLEIETLAGIIKPERVKGDATLVRVDMGKAITEGKLIPARAKGPIVDRTMRVLGKTFRITCVSMGNPHCVIFVKDVDSFDVERFGSAIEKNKFFPQRTNVEFVEIVNKRKVKMRVWERGSGETLACGTGACATAVAANLKGLTSAKVSVVLKGGTLKIDIEKDERVFMTGAAVEAFEGMVEI